MFEQMTKPEKERLAIRYISVEQQNIMRDFSEGKISKEEALLTRLQAIRGGLMQQLFI